MGSTISHLNNRLSFDYDEYIREREELAGRLREICAACENHRTSKHQLQVVSGTASVATTVTAGVVALVAAPATFGVSLPVVATTVGILGNSIAAASITGSAAAYGHGFVVNKDIVRQLENLQFMIDSISQKDGEVNALIKKLTMEKDGGSSSDADDGVDEEAGSVADVTAASSDDDDDVSGGAASADDASAGEQQKQKHSRQESLGGKYDIVTQAREKFDRRISFADEEKTKTGSLAAWSILSPGTFTLFKLGSAENHFKSEQEFEQALATAATKIETKTNVLRNLITEQQGSRASNIDTTNTNETTVTTTASQQQPVFTKFWSCLPSERQLSRGRLTFVDDKNRGRAMMVECYDPNTDAVIKIESDSTKVLRLPEKATRIKVWFMCAGNSKPVKKVDRAHPKQPWVKRKQNNSNKKKEKAGGDSGAAGAGADDNIDVFDIECGDGIDVVFVLRGVLAHTYVHKAWDFGRDPTRQQPRSWEWWPTDGADLEKDRDTFLPDSKQRNLQRGDDKVGPPSSCFWMSATSSSSSSSSAPSSCCLGAGAAGVVAPTEPNTTQVVAQ